MTVVSVKGVSVVFGRKTSESESDFELEESLDFSGIEPRTSVSLSSSSSVEEQESETSAIGNEAKLSYCD